MTACPFKIGDRVLMTPDAYRLDNLNRADDNRKSNSGVVTHLPHQRHGWLGVKRDGEETSGSWKPESWIRI